MLVICAERPGPKPSCVLVRIPVAVSALPIDHQQHLGKGLWSKVIGQYASVECVEHIAPEQPLMGLSENHWTMASTFHLHGSLPRTLWTRSASRQLARERGCFFRWAAKQRKKPRNLPLPPYWDKGLCATIRLRPGI